MGRELKLKINLNEYLPLRDIVFNTLREAIIKGDLDPGERLMENQLAEMLGVSRTPIREAIRKLELENLVVMIPRKGAEVASFSKKDIEDVLEVRAALEALAVKIACERISDENLVELERVKDEFAVAANNGDVDELVKLDVSFHDIIFRASGNDRLIQILNNLSEQIYRFRVKYINTITNYDELVKEHDAIVAYIKDQNREEAEKIAIEHIKKQEHAMVN